MTDLDLSGCPKLDYLYLDNINYLTTVDVSKNLVLTSLSLFTIPDLTTLTINGSTDSANNPSQIDWLQISEVFNLGFIDLSFQPNLKRFLIHDCGLTDLKVPSSVMSQLNDIELSVNKITDQAVWKKIIDVLPQKDPTADFKVKIPYDPREYNKMSTANADAIRAKGWIPKMQSNYGGVYRWVEFPGDSGI